MQVSLVGAFLLSYLLNSRSPPPAEQSKKHRGGTAPSHGSSGAGGQGGTALGQEHGLAPLGNTTTAEEQIAASDPSATAGAMEKTVIVTGETVNA